LITLHDLDEAIAECQGERNPNANTCIKLAAFYTIRKEMFPDPGQGAPEATHAPTQGVEVRPSINVRSAYSGDMEPSEPSEQAETIIDYNSGTEFSEAIDGLHADEVWPIMDELMSVIQATNIRLYNGVMRKIDQL
jgi:hypothetical protein